MTERPVGERTVRSERSQKYLDPLQVYAQADPQTRSMIEKELERIGSLDERELDLNARGLNYGVLVTVVFLGACVVLIAGGRGVEGTTLGVVFIVALVFILSVGRRR